MPIFRVSGWVEDDLFVGLPVLRISVFLISAPAYRWMVQLVICCIELVWIRYTSRDSTSCMLCMHHTQFPFSLTRTDGIAQPPAEIERN
jgi:hypothetical protein